jgi:thioredoxin reductase
MTDSAGQAAVHIATYAARVTLLVRGRSLADSMSKYLLRAIQSAPNIAVRYNVEVVGAAGHGRLERLTLKDRESGEAETVPAVALLVLVGAEPHYALAARRCRTRPVGVRGHRYGSAARRATFPGLAAAAPSPAP